MYVRGLPAHPPVPRVLPVGLVIRVLMFSLHNKLRHLLVVPRVPATASISVHIAHTHTHMHNHTHTNARICLLPSSSFSKRVQVHVYMYCTRTPVYVDSQVYRCSSMLLGGFAFVKHAFMWWKINRDYGDWRIVIALGLLGVALIAASFLV